jgi:hypothetical protein
MASGWALNWVRSYYGSRLRKLDVYWSLLQGAYDTVVFLHVKDQR